MAFTGRCAGATETAVGFDTSVPALYIPFQRRSEAPVQGGGVLNQERYQKGLEAKDFFMKFLNADCPRICVENPVSSKIYEMPTHTQEVQPWMFGHPVQKKTRLWLKGLPPLNPTNIVSPKCGCHAAGTWFMKGGKDRQKNRAKTFPGLARAMAEQWGGACQ